MIIGPRTTHAKFYVQNAAYDAETVLSRAVQGSA